MRALAPACLALIGALASAGCRQEMNVQPKLLANAQGHGAWRDGADRPLVSGTIARSALARQRESAHPPPITAALLTRGRERYAIFCSPCHGLDGQGDGMIVQRGFPKPPSYDSPKLLAASSRHLFDVITNGWGVMYPYGARVPPRDRWAIIAYIRALQVAHDPQLAAGSSPGGAP